MLNSPHAIQLARGVHHEQLTFVVALALVVDGAGEVLIDHGHPGLQLLRVVPRTHKICVNMKNFALNFSEIDQYLSGSNDFSVDRKLSTRSIR